MDDRELWERVKEIRDELDALLLVADDNSKYYTKSRLICARRDVDAAAGSLAWHVDR